MNLRFYISVAKGLKLKVRKFWGLILTFVEVTGEKLVGGRGAFLPPILNRVKTKSTIYDGLSDCNWTQTHNHLNH